MTTPPPSSDSLSATVEVETPELVVLSYTLAGIGSRAAAAIVDLLFLLVVVSGLFALIAWAAGGGEPVAAAAGRGDLSDALVQTILILFTFSIIWGYYVLCEALADGRTLGKRLLRLRVVRDGGYSVDLGASAVRNLVRLIDMQPFVLYLVGMTSTFFSRHGKRLGDYAAGTIVVREDFVRRRDLPAGRARAGAAGAVAESGAPDDVPHARLTDEEFTLLASFLQRRATLDPTRRREFAERLAARFRQAVPEGGGQSAEARLARLHAAERAARERGAAGRRTIGAARDRHAIVAAGSSRWNRFASTLARAQRGGLASLGEAGVREFVSEYRDLAADLARLRTASRGARNEETFYLGRLVAGAHNLLYRRRSTTLWQGLRYLVADVPREVRRSARPILLAAALFFLPAVVAYTAVVRDPAVAPTFIPDQMIERAERGIERARRGTGYIPDPQIFRPVMASQVVTNNVQVTFFAFAGGAALAAPTTMLLVMNGVSLGGVFGLYRSKGIGSLLLAFVAPHGVLELTAICIAGGAGFLLAAGVLLPGMRTRRRALVENGRRAIRLVAACTLLLVVAGTIEGFVSPIPSWSLGAKLAFSAATAVALALYLSGGRQRQLPVESEPGDGDEALLRLG